MFYEFWIQTHYFKYYLKVKLAIFSLYISHFISYLRDEMVKLTSDFMGHWSLQRVGHYSGLLSTEQGEILTQGYDSSVHFLTLLHSLG